MKNGYFFLVILSLFPMSGYGQGFNDIPPSEPNSNAAPAPFNLSAAQTPPAPTPAAFAPVTASAAVSPAPTASEKLPPPPTTQGTATIPSAPSTGQNWRTDPGLLRSKVSEDHPFARLMELPQDPQSSITGKPLTVAQLLHGTYSPAVRRQLLESYWELLGLLVECNIRRESEQLAASVRDTLQGQALHWFQQQRRSTEMEFVKKQWELSELFKRSKGRGFTENTLPLPCDYPVYKPYETYAKQIARSEQAKYLARLLPVQQQLVDAKHKSCEALSALSAATPNSSLQLVSLLNQRTAAFLELTQAVVEYNQMIAQYTAETVGPNVNYKQLVGAVIELSNPEQRSPAPQQRRSETTASPAPRRLSALPPEKNNEPVTSPAAVAVTLETAATTFNKPEQPKFPEMESASPGGQIAANFALPHKPVAKTTENAPESLAESPAEFPMFAEKELPKELKQNPPQPPRMSRPIQQVSHTE